MIYGKSKIGRYTEAITGNLGRGNSARYWPSHLKCGTPQRLGDVVGRSNKTELGCFPLPLTTTVPRQTITRVRTL
jgi:hypothetical protein